MPRNQPGAVLHDPVTIAERVRRIVIEGVVDAVDGSRVMVRADSVCVHGDTPAAVDMATEIRRLLTASDVAITPFT